MGHVLNYTLGDVVSHVRRRRGFSVLRPMGYDAFGLPAENAAIREGGHPREVTERNIERSAARSSGWAGRSTGRARSRRTSPSTTAGRSGSSCGCYEAGLAYRKAAPVKWCPNDQTVLANEQVIDGPLRALRRRGRVAEPRAVDVQDHRLRRPAARRDGAARVVARARADDAAQLDRPLRGRRGDLPRRGARRGRPRLHDAAGHAVRRDVLRARARASARRAVRRALAGTARSCARTRATPPRRRARSARRARTRPASSPASTRSTR